MLPIARGPGGPAVVAWIPDVPDLWPGRRNPPFVHRRSGALDWPGLGHCCRSASRLGTSGYADNGYSRTV